MYLKEITVIQNVKKLEFEGDWAKNLFAQAILDGVFGAGGGGIGWGWIGQVRFGIYFCVLFSCCCRSLVSTGGNGRWAISPLKFVIFLIFPYF